MGESLKRSAAGFGTISGHNETRKNYALRSVHRFEVLMIH
jgi:hypothetical protein